MPPGGACELDVDGDRIGQRLPDRPTLRQYLETSPAASGWRPCRRGDLFVQSVLRFRLSMVYSNDLSNTQVRPTSIAADCPGVRHGPGTTRPRQQPAIRPGFFPVVFAIIGLCGDRAPRRALTASKALHAGPAIWASSLNTVCFGWRFRWAAGMAAFATANGWGLLNHLQVHPGWRAIAVIAVMDFRDLVATRDGPCPLLAPARPPRRSRLRRDHRLALSIRSRSGCRCRSSSRPLPCSARQSWPW